MSISKLGAKVYLGKNFNQKKRYLSYLNVLKN